MHGVLASLSSNPLGSPLTPRVVSWYVRFLGSHCTEKAAPLVAARYASSSVARLRLDGPASSDANRFAG